MDNATPQKYIKSFSRGQITVPKEFRELLGLGDEFWLKLSIDQNKIIGEPVQNSGTTKAYADKLLTLKGDWFSENDWQEIRQEVAERLDANG